MRTRRATVLWTREGKRERSGFEDVNDRRDPEDAGRCSLKNGVPDSGLINENKADHMCWRMGDPIIDSSAGRSCPCGAPPSNSGFAPTRSSLRGLVLYLAPRSRSISTRRAEPRFGPYRGTPFVVGMPHSHTRTHTHLYEKMLRRISRVRLGTSAAGPNYVLSVLYCTESKYRPHLAVASCCALLAPRHTV